MDRVARIQGLRFPIRPSPKPDESYLGYVLRLVAANGVKLRRGYSLRIFGTDLGKLPTNRKCIDEAVRLSGAHGGWLSEAAYPPKSARPLEQYATFRGQAVKRAWLSLGSPRFCVHCLKDEGWHYRFLWDFRLFRRCLVHGTMLVGKCGCCKREITWSRWLDLQTEDFRCVCGSRILDAELDAGGQRRVVRKRHCEAGRYLAFRIAPDVYPQWRRETHPEIEKLPLEVLIELCFYLGAIADAASSRKNKPMSPTDARFVENRVSLGVEILLGWPESFHVVLRRLVRRSVRLGRTSTQTVFGPRTLNGVLERLGPAERLVSVELKKFRQTSFFREKVVKSPPAKRGSRIRPLGTITSSQALSVLQLSPSSLRCLLRIARREGVEHSLHAGQWWFNANQIHAVAKAYSVLVDLKQVGEILGFRPHILSDLRCSFHLPLVMRSINGRRALTCEVEDFQRLIGKAAEVPRSSLAGGGYIQGMEAFLDFSERGLSSADLVDAIVDDILPAKRIAGSDPQLGRLYFERKAIRAVARLLADRAGLGDQELETGNNHQMPVDERFDRSDRAMLIRQWKLEAAERKAKRKLGSFNRRD